MKDLDMEDASDEEISEKHSKLIDSVRELDKGQRIKKSERNEPSLTISEFHLVKNGVTDKDAIQLSDLMNTLGRKGHHTEITKQFKAAKNKVKVLPKPLEKPVAERIKRTIGFENTKKELQKWNAVVAQNRTAESISFPLNQSSMRLETTNDFVKRFRIESDLEKELAALEPIQKNVDEEDGIELSLEEILLRRAEAAKFRAQQSYKVAKAHRQNKIKSKKFHRIQRKDKMKQQLKEFEELQKVDPHGALEKLKHLEKIRAEERMTLRHKSTGHWARNKLIRAKYDKESRQDLAQQLSISRDLTQKIQISEDTDEESENETSVPVLNTFKENPWINKVKTESEIDQFIGQYRKYWENQNTKKDKEYQDNSDQQKKKEEISPEEHKDWKQNVSSDIDENNTSHILKKQTASVKHKTRKSVKSTQVINSKKRKVIGTSNWQVTSLNNSEDSSKNILSKTDMDEMFDSMHDKIKNTCEKKIKNIMRKHNLNVEDAQTEDVGNDDKEVDDDYFEKLQWKGRSKMTIEDQTLEETINNKNSQNKNVESHETLNGNIQGTAISLCRNPKEIKIDPNAFSEVKIKHLKTQLPDGNSAECEVLDDKDEEAVGYQLLNEAFSDEDVVEDFKKEKEEEVKKSTPEDVNLKLPGWGSWGGKNIKQSSRKKRRFILKFPKDAHRRDENKGNVIIIEENNPAIKKHQVTELPFPFVSVKDYEASLRAPIGRNFLPEKTHRRLIQPSIMTKMGQVIDPMDEESLINTKNLKKNRKPEVHKEFVKKLKV